jgi:hypothetical protein
MELALHSLGWLSLHSLGWLSQKQQRQPGLNSKN